MTVVLELNTVSDLLVALRAAGFESSTVHALTWQDEDRLLGHFYSRPSSVSAVAFTDALFAACLVPRRRGSDIAALSEGDRTRLRRAVVLLFGQGRAWRELYRSHLTPDERLFTVVLNRWRRREAVRAQLIALREEWAERSAGAADAVGAFSRRFDMPEVKLPNFEMPTVKVPQLSASVTEALTSPMALGLQSVVSDAVKSLNVFKTALPSSFRERFMSPLPTQLYGPAAMVETFNFPALAAVKAFSDSFAVQVRPSLMRSY